MLVYQVLYICLATELRKSHVLSIKNGTEDKNNYYKVRYLARVLYLPQFFLYMMTVCDHDKKTLVMKFHMYSSLRFKKGEQIFRVKNIV